LTILASLGKNQREILSDIFCIRFSRAPEQNPSV
jgi:hypothetical protein